MLHTWARMRSAEIRWRGEEEYLFVDGVAFLLVHRLVGCLTLVLVDSVADLCRD